MYHLNSFLTLGQSVILVVTIFIAWICMEFGANNRPRKFEGVEIDSVDGEYEFLNQIEGIDSQLDLVRAYIAMGERDSAMAALMYIIKYGNATQKQEALLLQSQINK